MAAKKKAPRAKPAPKKPGTKPRRGVKLKPAELAPSELPITELPAELAVLAEQVRADGGALIGAYREPLGGQPILLVALPVAAVAPTPFQRDVSDAHVLRLTRAMDKTKRFLDPIIVVREERDEARYWTPNGNHRLTALRELGATSVVALLVPERAVAYQILALNIEKAHNLRERALEVQRMYLDLVGFSKQPETDYELEFEEPALVTLGFCYLERGRFSGGAYNPVLRKVDSWVKAALPTALEERKRRARVVLELDDAVTGAVERLKAAGLTSPYLRTFVVARINPLRFIKGELPGFDELMATMTKRATGLNAGKVRAEDLARSGGAPEE
jgi:ParB family chromosome partitioning protein